jgi:DNA-binding MarR family transcriptional regulator
MWVRCDALRLGWKEIFNKPEWDDDILRQQTDRNIAVPEEVYSDKVVEMFPPAKPSPPKTRVEPAERRAAARARIGPLNTPTFRVVRQPEIWTNQHVLFCSAQIDDAQIPYRSFRVLLDLKRRIGRRCDQNSNINPGSNAIARTCRMNRQSVIEALRWLEEHGYIKLTRGKNGTRHHYRVLVPDKDLYIDQRLDDAGFSPAEIRVMAHISRLSNDIGLFFINHLKFARICCMNRDTVKTALERFEDKELIIAYDYRENPMWCFHLCDLYPRYAENEER